MEPRNADRARLLLGVTYAILADATGEAIRDSAALLDRRIEVRLCSPIIVAKYLTCRDTRHSARCSVKLAGPSAKPVAMLRST